MPVTASRTVRGALVAIGILAAVWLAYARPNPFDDPRVVHAVLDDASGIAVVGAEVHVAGSPVGRIAGHERRGEDSVLRLELDADAPQVRRDARLVLRPRLAFEGTAFADLDPGSPEAAPLGDAELPRDRTGRAVGLEDVLRTADAPTRAALRAAADGLARGLDAAPAQALDRTLRRAPALLGEVARSARAAQGTRPGALRGAVRGLSRTASALAASERDLAPALRATAATARALATGTGRPLQDAVDALPATARALRSGGADLERTLGALRPLADDLRPGARALPGALRAARPLLREAAPTLRAAGPLVSDADRALAGLRTGAAPARALLRRATPTLRTLDTTLLPALRKDTPSLGIPSYLAFFNLFAGGGGASRPYIAPGAPGSDAGTGHFMRFGFRFLTGLGVPAPPCAPLETQAPQLAASLNEAGLCTP